MRATADRLWALIEPHVAAEGVELDDLEIVGNDRARILGVTVDSDGGIGVDRIARLSRGIGRLLDEDDSFERAYTLEVGSPGLERKLRRPEHYRKSLGREAKVKTMKEIDGTKGHRGTLQDVDESGFILDIDGTPRRIDFDDVASARTVFVWDKGAKAHSDRKRN